MQQPEAQYTLIAEFRVDGRPRPQGSMVTIPNPHFGKINQKNGKPHRATITIHDSEYLKTWRKAVGWSARSAMGAREPLRGAVSLDIWFAFEKSKAAVDAGRDFPIGFRDSSDIDKLERAILDAMKGITYLDDRQVVEVHKENLFDDHDSVTIRIHEKTATGTLFDGSQPSTPNPQENHERQSWSASDCEIVR